MEVIRSPSVGSADSSHKGGASSSHYDPPPLGEVASAQHTTEGARAKIEKTARDFEASFLSVMLGQMFSGQETSAPFGGGQGEQMFKSFLSDSFAKSMAQHGGIGVSKAVAAELMKLQGLSQ